MRRPSEPMDSWWLCEQLLELSSMSENEEGFSVVLPRSDAVKAQRDWHATEKEVCKAEMKLAVPNDEARAAKVLLYEPQHADAPSLQLAAEVLSPIPSHRRGHESAAAFSRSAPRRGAPRQAVRRPAAAAGKFSPHAGALTHRNGISALATHPPLHADVPFPQLAAAVHSPSRSHELPKAPSKESWKK